MSAAILQNLSTEAELQDLYSTMNVDGVALPAPPSTTDGSYHKDLPPDDAGLDDAISEIAIATADKLVPQKPLGKRKERSAQLPSHLNRELCNAKRQEMAMVVLRDHAKEKDIASPSEGKRRDDREVPSTRWLEMMHNHVNRVELEEIAHLRVNSVFPIIYCTNNKNINDIANWAPCILRKVRKEQYEVLDQHEQDQLKEDLPWGGDDGLSASLSMYIKNPNKEFLDAYLEDLEDAMNDIETHDVSPHHHNLRKKAAENVQKKADSVKKTVLKKSPSLVFKLGDVVLIPLDDVNRTKVDGANLAGVVVLMSKLKSTCRVAVKQGVLKRAYVYHVLKPVPEASNNLDAAMDMREAYKNWRSLPTMTEREAARFISSVGGQGIIHCNCRGSCTTNGCSCKKAGRLCSSRCHRNSKNCKNTHEE